MSFRTILVPLDGSELAERALPYAEQLSRVLSARLVLVRAARTHAFLGADVSDSQLEVIREAEDYVATVQADLSARGIDADTAVPYGEPAPAILDEIQLRRADLVVMATHGRSGVGRMLYGSVIEAVLHASPVPVLAVRAWEEEAREVFGSPPRLLVPLDGSPFAEAALPTAAALGAQLKAEIVLLHVAPAPRRVLTDERGTIISYLDQQEALLRQVALDYLREARAGLLQADATLSVEVSVSLDDAVNGIAQLARERRIDLVVMATHGRTGVGKIVFGSVAGGVLRQGSVPLLLVRPSGDEAGGEPVRAEEAASQSRAATGATPIVKATASS